MSASDDKKACLSISYHASLPCPASTPTLGCVASNKPVAIDRVRVALLGGTVCAHYGSGSRPYHKKSLHPGSAPWRPDFRGETLLALRQSAERKLPRKRRINLPRESTIIGADREMAPVAAAVSRDGIVYLLAGEIYSGILSVADAV